MNLNELLRNKIVYENCHLVLLEPGKEGKLIARAIGVFNRPAQAKDFRSVDKEVAFDVHNYLNYYVCAVFGYSRACTTVQICKPEDTPVYNS